MGLFDGVGKGGSGCNILKEGGQGVRLHPQAVIYQEKFQHQ